MINGLCKRNLLDEALTLSSMMEDNDCMSDAITFDIMICALLEKDETDKTNKFLHEMINRGLLKSD